MRKLAGFFISIAVMAGILVSSFSAAAYAAVINPLTVQYDEVVFGDFVIAGNVSTTCPTSFAWSNPLCATGRGTNSSGLTTDYINDAFYMEYVDVDGDPATWNSSTARITIPAGATIDYARLWWMGSTGDSRINGSPWFACNSTRPDSSRPAKATAPPGFANQAFVPSSHPVKFKIGAAAYQDMTPEAGRFYQDPTAASSGRHYVTSRDIQAILAAQPTGVPLDITVGNIWTPKGHNCTGGFAITYVYKYNGPAAAAPQARQVLVFDGLVAQGAADAPTTTNLTGFTLASGARRLGVGIIEGDQGITGDQVKANGVALTEPRITPSTTTNYNASTVDGMQNPIYPNSYGLDAKSREVSPTILPDGLTNVPLTFTTSGDQYLPFLFAFSAPVVTNFISGMVWNDADGDGVLDPGEAPIPGATITLTGTDVSSGVINRTVTTDAGGAYRFDGLLNGTYEVTETQPAAFANSPGTTTTQYVANARTGLTFSGAVPTGITSVNFAEIQSSLAGSVYHDQDADGNRDVGEPGIGGVTVQLTGTDASGAAVGRTTTTSAVDGSYSFAGLAPGTYTVTEIHPSGWGDGAETVGSSGGSAAVNDKILAINLAGGVNATGYDFGERKVGLAGNVYSDLDNDGVKDAGESGIGGVTVTLAGTSASGAAVTATTTTAVDGTYSFNDLVPGTYTVTETQPAGYSDGIDTVGNVAGVPTGTSTNDQFASITLTGAASGAEYNFGERPGGISGKVWYDADRDGVIDPTETTGLGGVTITLTKPDGSTVTATTAADGTYSFTGLPGGTYTITETQPGGYGSSTTDSLVGVVLPGGGSVVNQNFGDTLSTIAGTVYIDGNTNGSLTAGEDGIANVTVTLRGPGGATIATTTTDASGNYLFTGIPAGTYSVVESPPPFVTDAQETAGSAGGDISVNDTISAINVGAGVDATGYNFGETGANISGKVYVDLDNDGAIDTGEPGIAGVTLVLEARACVNALGQTFVPLAGGTCPGLQTIQWVAYDNTTTGADGSYVFLGNDPLLVYRITETQPASYADGIATGGTNGSVTTQAPSEVIQIGQINYSVVLGAGGSTNNNFGELAGEISGYAYHDAANDNSRTGDVAIEGVVVALTSGAQTWTAVTDASGFYRFLGLPISAGGVTYTIEETQPATYFDGQESTPGTANPGGANDTIEVTLTTGTNNRVENNFGERLGSIAGQVWFDADEDGVHDGPETTGIPTTVTLLDGAGNTVASAPTLPDGTYSFFDLAPGEYAVVETQPAGYGSSTPDSVPVTLASVSVSGVDFGEILGSIAGAVYVDVNRNGERDPGEPGIANVDVTITKPDTTTAVVQTDPSGNYLFAGLPAGDYTITESQPATYNDGAETLGTTGGTTTAPDSFTTVSLGAGEDAVAYLFGEMSPSVEGTVYVDENRSGTRDPGEPGIPGVVLTLTGPGGVNESVTTDLDGDYLFPSVPIGAGYTITETHPVGYGSSEQPTNAITGVTVPLAGLDDQNFGETTSTVAGTVYNDVNDNGVMDGAEAGIVGATVRLSGTDAAGQPVSLTATTDAAGDYDFAGLLAGTYTVEEDQPVDFDDGTDAPGTVDAGPTGAQTAYATPDKIASVALAAEDDGVDFDFGEIGTWIEGTVFRDVDADGTMNTGDTPISGVTVELYDSTGLVLLDTVITGADGSYRFDGLPGGDYVVIETQPATYADTSGPLGPNSRNVTAPPGGVGGVDFGEVRGSILGTVWVDRDRDAVRDYEADAPFAPIDAGIAGVTVTLSDTDPGTPDIVVVTDANGDYLFDDLAPGTYTVTETQPADYGDAGDFPGSLGGNTGTNDVIDGIVLVAGEVGVNYDFAEVGASISGTVWVDANNDGVIDGGEAGRLGNVMLTLDDGDPATIDAVTFTDGGGMYEFMGVPVGSYTIMQTQPDGYASTVPSTNELPVSVAVVGGVITDVTDQNFGEMLGALGDLVWLDLDGNGIQNGSEPGLADIDVTAQATIDGVPTLLSTVTAPDGTYEFLDLPLGDWTVTVDTASLPAGLAPTFDNDGIASAHESTTTLDTTTVASLDEDFGYRGPGGLGDVVWNDLNGDGVQDPGEPGLPGVGVSATITHLGRPLTLTTTTDPTGAYSFANLPLGDWTVTVDVMTLPQGLNPSHDSDGTGTAHTSVVTLSVADPVSDVEDFGYQGAGSLGDFVWIDLNGDGAQDLGEPGLGGVEVTVTTDVNGTPLTYTTTTDAAGAYSLAGLPLGDFTITLDPADIPAGMTSTFDPDGGADGAAAVTLTPGAPVNLDQDFGYEGPGTLGDLIWLDLDGDGAKGVDEPGLSGVGVTASATINGSPVSQVTATDAAGAYGFDGLPVGDWTITLDPATLPGGAISTADPDGGSDDTATVTLTVASPDDVDQDFGYNGPGELGDTVWHDLNADGVHDAGEPGIAGVDVTATITINGTPITLTTTTDADGAYSFTGLPLGGWTVTVDASMIPAGLMPVFDHDGTGTPHTSTITLSAGAPTSDLEDFGYRGPGEVGDRVWLDLNGDGMQDAGEPGLPGVDVTVSIDVLGRPYTYRTTTDAAGDYVVSGLMLGDFTVTVDAADLPVGAAATFDGDGAATPNTSDVALTLLAPTNRDQDFGYEGPGELGDLVWLDRDGDGIAVADEPGLAGVTVTAETTINGVVITLTTTTDATGAYAFAGLPLGDWTVTVDPASLPAGVVNTGDPDGGNDDTADVTLSAIASVDVDQDFGYQGPGVIGDLVWNDLNGDGVQDPGEPGLPGVEVTVTTTIGATPVTFTTTTDPSGAYEFTGLPLGDWTVAVDPATVPVGMVNTGDPDGGNDDTALIALTPLVPTSDAQDFGYEGPGALGDLVWLDLDGDGTQNSPAEIGLGNVDLTITTDIAGTTVTYSVTTDVSGAYSLVGLPVGDYTVTVDPATLPDGSVQTFDADGTTTADSSTVTLTLVAGSNLDQDFGYGGPGHIGDTIWLDVDGDGVHDIDEPGLPGVEVTVSATIAGQPVTVTATTDTAGRYSIDGLPLGDWTVTLDPATLPGGLTNTADPDGGSDSTALVTLTAAVPNRNDQDFGYLGEGSIGDRVWNDQNGDGVQDAGEPGLAGIDITVTITIAGTPLTFTATTDATGDYVIDGLAHGGYGVTVDVADLPAGMVNSADPDGGNDSTALVTLDAAAPDNDVQDFGYQGPGSLGDLVWLDLDGDGTVDAGERGLAGVEITVRTTVNATTVTYTVTTDSAGTYSLGGLPVGDYTVVVDPATLPAGAEATFDADGIATPDTSGVTLTLAAASNLDQDFGYRGPGEIGDLVWNDGDGDGTQDADEPGLPGVEVTVSSIANGQPVVLTATTDPAGAYHFGGLPLADWTVTVDPASLPAGMSNTGDPDGGNDDTAAIALTAGAPTSDAQDFGYQGLGGIGDFVWIDADADGVQDAGEPGLANVGVTITTVVAGTTLTYTDQTDSAGAYSIAGLPLGDYTVVIDVAGLPAGVSQTFDSDGILTANTSAVTLDVVVPINGDQDFGYEGPGEIGNLIWNDLDGDGMQEPGEPGLPGVDVSVTTTVGGVPFTLTTTTDASGAYVFTGLPTGVFTVEVDPTTLPGAMVNTGDPDGGNDDTASVTLTIADPISDVEDFGYQGPGVIGDLVWNDLDGDGLVDPGEPGLPGVEVTITTTIAGTALTYSTTTDPTGAYEVSGLPVGDFTVTVEPASLPPALTNTGDPDAGGDSTALVTLTAADPTSDIQDFGYQGPGALGDLVWNDRDADSAVGAGELGLPNVDLTVTTVIAGSPVTYVVTTDASGGYDLSGLPLGDFTVTVDSTTLPAGVAATFDADGIGTAHVSAVTLTLVAPISDIQDFGYTGEAVIGDLVWNDRDGDGLVAAGEPGLPGVSVTLSAVVNGVTQTWTDVTDASGAYQFAGLPLGAFTVTVDAATLPAGVVNTGDPDGGADGTSDTTLDAIDPADDTQDFGYQGPGVIGDLIWNDLDGDGIVDPGEPGLPGVIVTATVMINGTPVEYTTTTGPTGAYRFEGLPLGDYTVAVDPSSLPPGVANTGDPDGGNDDVAMVVLTGAAPTSDVQDFGYQGVGSIGDRLWLDRNGDGVQDVDEPGLPGVQVTASTMVNGSIVIWIATTDGAGNYLIDGLPFGDFTVTVDAADLPDGVVVTFDADGTGTPHTSAVTLSLAAADNLDQDFGYRGPGMVGDLVWNDQDGDGVVDPGEPGLPGVEVTVTTLVNGTPVAVTVTTDPAGLYQIDGLPLGEMTVSVDPLSLPPGVGNTGDPDGGNDDAAVVTLTAADPTSDIQDFGYQGPGSLGDRVWLDLNGDGLQDAGEPGLPGIDVTVSTVVAGSPVTWTTTTDAAGSYLIEGLPLGDYTVTIDTADLPVGVAPTGDADGIVTAHTSNTTLTAAAPAVDSQDFGYVGPGTIGDLVWLDVNGDGMPAAGEPGLPGVEVTATIEVNGVPVEVVVTSRPDGTYVVAGLPLGAVTVTVDPLTLAPGAEPTVDADGVATPHTSVVTLTLVDPTVDSQDFGYDGPGEIGDRVWNDQNGDGVQDTDEPGIPGVAIVVATTVNGTPINVPTTTGPDGAYLVDGLPLGDWAVTIQPASLPVGVEQTFDLDGVLDHTSMVTLTVAAPASDVHDFGYRGPGEIGDRVWLDQNGDGLQDQGEPGLPGVTVTVTTTIAGQPVTTTTATGPDGSWAVVGLPVGEYTITVNPLSIPAELLPTGDADGVLTPHSSVVTLTLVAPSTDTQDFGYQGPGVIGDLVWNDLDGDGVQDPGAPGLPGVEIAVTTSVNGEPLTVVAITGPDGTYQVAGLPLGEFTVTVDPLSLPGGVLPVGDPDGGNDHTAVLTLTAAEPATDIQDFAYQGPGAIGDLVWNDLNRDGIATDNEPGIPGVDVIVMTEIAGQPVAVVTTTDGEGAYSVTGLPLGDYSVTVDPLTLPSEVTGTFDGDDAADGTLETPNTSLVTLSDVEPIAAAEDFGYAGPGEIGDLVWDDLDGDGAPDPGEPGFANVDLVVTTTIDGVIVTYPVTTGPDGVYSLPGLPLGSFTVTVDPADLPSGVVPTFDSDTPATPHVSVVALTFDEPVTDGEDFGQYQPSSIGDLIWEDVDGDGIQDVGEPGIVDVAIRLTGTDGLGGQVDLVVATRPDGTYLFGGLAPGLYTASVTPPAGWALTPSERGADAQADSNGLTTALTMTSNEDEIGVDTGLYRPTSIAGVVFYDADASSVVSTGDPGIPGVAITLAGTSGGGDPVTGSLTTAPDGSYMFTGLPPGRYSLTEAHPIEWADGAETAPPGANSTTNDVIGEISLVSGIPVSGANFGELGWPIAGVVTIDGTNTPLPGVTMTLRGTDVTGRPVERIVVTQSCQTAENSTQCITGGFEMANVPPGRYILSETQPAGFDNGRETPANEIEIFLSAGPSLGNRFSETASSISGVVFADDNDNGLKEDSEWPLPGVTITISGIDASGNPITRVTETDDTGRWTFPDLPAGTYTVTETQPGDWRDGKVTIGTGGGTPGVNEVRLTVASGASLTGYLFAEIPNRSRGALPTTGGSTGSPLRLGGLLAAAGLALLLVAGRRRRRVNAA